MTMDGAWLFENGYWALCLLSFLAATLLPIGSEWLLALLLLKGLDPAVLIIFATLGNSLGALTTYGVGLWGGAYLGRKVLRISEDARQKAESVYRRYGIWSLLLAWIPIIGDPICLIGGLLHAGWFRFILLVTIGKLLRYLVFTVAVLEGSSLL